jgi:cytidylate kinase
VTNSAPIAQQGIAQQGSTQQGSTQQASSRQDTAGQDASGQHGLPGAPGGPVIAVDGPAGSGKSSAARGVARALGLRYLDTGAMYRALTWWLLSRQVDVTDPAAVLASFRKTSIEVGTDPAAAGISVHGEDVAGPIRTREVSNAVSFVAALPQVREQLIAQQKAIISAAAASGAGIVAEGRDIGGVVAPDADVKVFLTASEEVRARRRSADLAADPAVTAELTRQEQARRDGRDAPQMTRAAGATEIDTSDLNLDEVIAAIVGLVTHRGAVPRA